MEQALESVGMSDYADKTLDRMSDGECQRIMIARALAQQTPINLLDEPTAFLDMPNRYELCTLLRAIAQLGEVLSGEILLDGRPLQTLAPSEMASMVAFVTTDKVRIANLRCRDVVALGRAPYTNWIGRRQ